LLNAINQSDAQTNYWNANAGAGQINTALYPNGLTGITVRLYILTNTVGMYELRFVDQVIAEQITANNLAAISANLGVISAGILQSTNLDADEGVLIDLDNESIKFGGTTNPSLEWDGAKVQLNIADEGSVNVGDAGAITVGEAGKITLDDGGFVRVGNNIEITSKDQGGQIIVSEDAAINPVSDTLNLTGVDYLTISQGNVDSYYWDGSIHHSYRSLTRMESGIANNDEWIYLPGIFKSAPRVLISPQYMPSYSVKYKDQDQKVRFDIVNLEEYSTYRWRFRARATLELAAGSIGNSTDQITSSTRTNFYTANIQLPVNTRKLVVGFENVCYKSDQHQDPIYSGTGKDRVFTGDYDNYSMMENVKRTITLEVWKKGASIWTPGDSAIIKPSDNGNVFQVYALTLSTITESIDIQWFRFHHVINKTVGDARRKDGLYGDGYTTKHTVESYSSDLANTNVIVSGVLNWLAIGD
jgi:hypothetical protein